MKDQAQIIYYQNSHGRSGHQLKDLFTSVILGELLGLETVFGSSWQKQSLLPAVPWEQPRATRALRMPLPQNAWDGISFEQFQEITRTVKAKRNDSVLFVFSGVCRIHLSQLHAWEVAQRIPNGTFERCLARLQKLYWGPKTPQQFRQGQVAIHARRGDVADPNHHEYHHMGPGAWGTDFYQEKIDTIQEQRQPTKITLYSEKERSEDLQELQGVTLDLGGTECLQRHFHEMITAEYFMPSCSSLSTWAAYLSQGKVLVPDKEIKHFDHPEPLPNWIHF